MTLYVVLQHSCFSLYCYLFLTGLQLSANNVLKTVHSFGEKKRTHNDISSTTAKRQKVAPLSPDMAQQYDRNMHLCTDQFLSNFKFCTMPTADNLLNDCIATNGFYCNDTIEKDSRLQVESSRETNFQSLEPHLHLLKYLVNMYTRPATYNVDFGSIDTIITRTRCAIIEGFTTSRLGLLIVVSRIFELLMTHQLEKERRNHQHKFDDSLLVHIIVSLCILTTTLFNFDYLHEYIQMDYAPDDEDTPTTSDDVSELTSDTSQAVMGVTEEQTRTRLHNHSFMWTI